MAAGDSVCFGGIEDGRTFDPTADPPFGYRVMSIQFRAKSRTLFIPTHLNKNRLQSSVLLSALRRVDSEVQK